MGGGAATGCQLASWFAAFGAHVRVLEVAPHLLSEHKLVPHEGLTDPEYSSVGLTEEHARADQDCVVAVAPYQALDRRRIDNHSEGLCKLIVSSTTHRILGAHILGEQDWEVLQHVATAMAGDMQVEQLARLELVYRTFTGIVGLVARQIIPELDRSGISPQAQDQGKMYIAEWEHGEA